MFLCKSKIWKVFVLLYTHGNYCIIFRLTSICQDMNRKSSKNSLSYDRIFFLFLNNCTFTLVHINYDTCNCSFKNQNWTVKIFRNYICSYFSWLIFLIYFYLAKTPKTHLYTYVVLRLKLLKFKGIESFPSEFLNWLSYLTLTFSTQLDTYYYFS